MMISAEYYSLVYHIVIAIIVVMMSLPMVISEDVNILTASKYNWFAPILLVITILFIGLRDPYASFTYLGDTRAYTRMFESATFPSFDTARDIGFELFLFFCSQLMTIQWFYLLCAAIYVLLPYLAFQKWFGTRAWIALIVYITAMSFWSFGINGLRNGLAAAFFIYGVSFSKQPIKMAVWFVFSVFFHKSMLLPIGAFLLTKVTSNTKLLVWIWALAIPISFFWGNNLEIFISNLFEVINLKDKRIDNLFADEIQGAEMSRAFRFDFILYSSAAIIMGLYYTVKLKFNDPLYTRILNTYIISNTVWIFMIYAAYTNRTAYLSWFLMPVILIYPLLKKVLIDKQINWVFWTIGGSLLFTLIMFFR